MAIKKSSTNFSALDNLFGSSTPSNNTLTKTESQVIGKKKAALNALDNIFGKDNKPFEPAWSPPKEPSAFQKLLSKTGSAISSGAKTVASKVSEISAKQNPDNTSVANRLFPNAKSNAITQNNENLFKVKGTKAAAESSSLFINPDKKQEPKYGWEVLNTPFAKKTAVGVEKNTSDLGVKAAAKIKSTAEFLGSRAVPAKNKIAYLSEQAAKKVVPFFDLVDDSFITSLSKRTDIFKKSEEDLNTRYQTNLDRMLTKRNNPSNPEAVKFLYNLQDAGPQTLIGVALGLVPFVGPAAATGYFVSLSSAEQIKERGKVTSPLNIAIDTLGDRLLGGIIGKLAKTPKKLLTRAVSGFVTEGGTEVGQTVLKLSNDYRNAKTPDEKQGVFQKFKSYVSNGDILREFGLGGVIGAGVTASLGGDVSSENQVGMTENTTQPNVAINAQTSPLSPQTASPEAITPKPGVSNVSVQELPSKIAGLSDIFSTFKESLPVSNKINQETESVQVESSAPNTQTSRAAVRPEDLVIKKEVKNDIYLEKSGDNYLFQETSLKKLVKAVKGTDSRISDENAYQKASVALKQANEAFSAGQNAVQITEIGGRKLETPIRLVKAEMKGKLPEDIAANAKPSKSGKINPEQFKYAGWSQEMESQYDAFKKVMLRFPNPKVKDKLTNGDAETFKNVVRKYGISPERVDNMLYSGEKTNHEVFEEFLDRFYNRNKPVDDIDAKFEQYYKKLKEGGKTDEQLISDMDSYSVEDIWGKPELIEDNKLDSLIKQTEEQIKQYENESKKTEAETPASKEVESSEKGDKNKDFLKASKKYPRYVSPEQWTEGLSEKFGNTVKLYHQTDADNVPDILKNGFKSGSEFGDDVFFVMEEKIDRVGGKGSDYIVVEVPKNYFDRLFPDERSMSDIFTEKESDLDGDDKEAIMRSHILNHKTSKGFDILMNADEVKTDWIKILENNKGGQTIFEKKTDLTLKTFSWLEGKETVSKQYIQDLTNRGDIKQVEREMIRESLETEGDKINVKDFITKVKAELLPLKRIDLGESDDIMNGDSSLRYEFVSLPGDIRGSVANYSEVIYESPVKTSAGDIHFRDSTEKYFGHIRYEDMAIGAEKTGVELDGNPIYDMPSQPGDTELRRIIEVQTDLYQRGRLAQEGIIKEFPMGNGKVGKAIENPKKGESFTEAEKRIKQLNQYNDPSAHFRMVREEVKNAANQGIQRLQLPTGETAMKIEGLGDNTQWRNADISNEKFGTKLKISELEVGKEVEQGDGAYNVSRWIITDVVEGGKFKAVRKFYYNDYVNSKKVGLNTDAEAYQESFDISGKVDTNNPIYKFYQKDLGRYLTSKYGAKVVTDENGVSWFEINVKPEYAERPVEAFGKKSSNLPDSRKNPFKNKREEAKFEYNNLTPDQARTELYKMFPKTDVELVEWELGTVFERTGQIFGKDILGNYILGDGVINVVMNDGRVNNRTVYHEAFHHYLNIYHPFMDKGNLLNQIYRENKTYIDEKKADYGDDINLKTEEFLADAFSDYVAGKQTFKGRVESFFQAIVRRIRGMIGKLSANDRAKNLFERIASGEAKTMRKNKIFSDSRLVFNKKNRLKPSDLSSEQHNSLARMVTKISEINTKVDVPEPVISSLPFWKDKAALFMSRETMERNLDDIAGDYAPEIKEFLTERVKVNETMRAVFITTLREKVETDIVKKLGIRKNSSLSSLVQRFGEGVIDQKTLMEKTDKWAEVMEAAEYLRNVYDNMLDMWNDVRKSFGYEPVPKRKDYFRHGNFISSFDSLAVILRENDLPTSISGRTYMFKPGTPFSTAALKRLGVKTDYDAVSGIDNYIDAVSRSIFHTDSVQRGRALETVVGKGSEMIENENLEIRQRNQERADQNSNERMEQEIPEINLPNFQANLIEWTNLVAGKKSLLDRGGESTAGRRIYTVVNWLRSRVSANMIGGNISSAITNFIPVTQLLATTNKISVARGLAEVPKGISDARVIDGQKSGFLSRRFAKEKIDMSAWDKTRAGLNYMFKAVDLFTSRWTVASKYYENLSKGMSRVEALREADNYAGKVITDRSIGQLPNFFGSKTLGVFTQFQTEVNNQWSFITKDMPMMSKGNKLKLLSSMIQLFLYSYLFNELYEKIIGRRPAIDPIYNAMTLAGQTVEGKNKPLAKRTGLAIEDIAGNLPFTGGITGGRLPMFAGLPDILGTLKGEKDVKKGLLSPSYYLLFPIAGGQVKKTYEGVSAFNEGGSYSKSGLLQFPIDQTGENMIKTGIFGKYSTGDSKLYYGEERSPLGKLQTKEYQRLLQYNPSQARPYYDRIIDKREKKRDN
jgi:hypothetical protein